MPPYAGQRLFEAPLPAENAARVPRRYLHRCISAVYMYTGPRRAGGHRGAHSRAGSSALSGAWSAVPDSLSSQRGKGARLPHPEGGRYRPPLAAAWALNTRAFAIRSTSFSLSVGGMPNGIETWPRGRSAEQCRLRSKSEQVVPVEK